MRSATAARRNVTVVAEADGAALVLSIADDGCGLPRAARLRASPRRRALRARGHGRAGARRSVASLEHRRPAPAAATIVTARVPPAPDRAPRTASRASSCAAAAVGGVARRPRRGAREPVCEDASMIRVHDRRRQPGDPSRGRRAARGGGRHRGGRRGGGWARGAPRRRRGQPRRRAARRAHAGDGWR